MEKVLPVERENIRKTHRIHGAKRGTT